MTAKNLEDFYSEHMVLDSPNLFGDEPVTPLLGYRSAGMYRSRSVLPVVNTPLGI